MTRGMAVVLTLLVIGFAIFAGWYSNQRTDYFPRDLQNTFTLCEPAPGTFDRQAVMNDFEDEWFSGELSAFHEPSLYHRPARSLRSIRFTWIRSFHDTVVVRINTLADGRQQLTAKQRPGGTGFGAGAGVRYGREVVRVLTPAELNALQVAVDTNRLLVAPSSGCSCCLDGARWIIEANDPESGYRYHSRQSPKDGFERTLGLHLLGLTGWNIEPLY